MRTAKVLLLLAVFFLPMVTQAANVCIWNYDTLDRFYDPQLNDSIDCAYWFQQILTNQGHTVDVCHGYLPTDLSGYDIVFCLMGWYRC
jgi:hypothetical protein